MSLPPRSTRGLLKTADGFSSAPARSSLLLYVILSGTVGVKGSGGVWPWILDKWGGPLFCYSNEQYPFYYSHSGNFHWPGGPTGPPWPQWSSATATSAAFNRTDLSPSTSMPRRHRCTMLVDLSVVDQSYGSRIMFLIFNIWLSETYKVTASD